MKGLEEGDSLPHSRNSLHIEHGRNPRNLLGKLMIVAALAYVSWTTWFQSRPQAILTSGPGGSGTSMLWAKGKLFGDMYTDGQMDVLGFDPRVSGYDTLDRMDAMNEALMQGCEAKYGDMPRFLTTAFVARDVDAIRDALGEETLTAFMVSYGTGIGESSNGDTGRVRLADKPAQAKMFPDRVGNIALDGMEFVRDGWNPWGWGVTSLDNVTDAFEDGFIGECVRAGPKACSLASDHLNTGDDYHAARKALSLRVHKLFDDIKKRPIPAVSSQGPGIVTYEELVGWLYSILYQPPQWKDSARLLAELEMGNATSALVQWHQQRFSFDPTKESKELKSDELESMVICGDAAGAESHSLDWWKVLHLNMTKKSWISGSSRLLATLPCRHFKWEPAEVYRGGFNHTLRHPLLLIGSPYDPATPLRNGRRLAKEMGDNARMLVHHGYGHSSARDLSSCTNAIVQSYILNGTLPETAEVHCEPDKKPYDVDFQGFA
ncbi:hypothetical protein IAR55_002007 [Kwoniella newhampshirensis]|uniref:Peptidase S33 tripeptidyl aminopeptidase-like C-terminal domain-containing protein n=1 Tax=Kwoniella newhampshirensis TaxID=1651941 RepID=A0AAW0Z0S6_9TREE